MRPTITVIINPFSQACLKIPDRLKFIDINQLIFDRPPEAFDKNVIQRSAATIHTDPNAVLLQYAGKLHARILAALIRIEYLRLETG